MATGNACTTGSAGPGIRVVDFVRRFGHAETRPVSGQFRLAQHTLEGTVRASIDVPVPSRAIWTLPIPRRATLNTRVGVLPPAGHAVVRFRIGVSDDRIYEELASQRVPAGAGWNGGWTAMAVDLSAYAGWKWSLFYRPESRDWRIVLSADAMEGAGVRAVWGEPGIDTGVAEARRFLHDRLDYRRPD